MTPVTGVFGSSAMSVDPIAMRLTLSPPAPAGPPVAPVASFADVMGAGLRSVEGKLASADALVRRFALDDEVPVHQVTFALEEARLSVELAMQVRARLVEAYRDVMGMQL